jgi:hypothetical protein
MHEAWLCQCSKGKISSLSRNGLSWLAGLPPAAPQRHENTNQDRIAFIGGFRQRLEHPTGAGVAGTEESCAHAKSNRQNAGDGERFFDFSQRGQLASGSGLTGVHG